jgi:hypothetical protein
MYSKSATWTININNITRPRVRGQSCPPRNSNGLQYHQRYCLETALIDSHILSRRVATYIFLFSGTYHNITTMFLPAFGWCKLATVHDLITVLHSSARYVTPGKAGIIKWRLNCKYTITTATTATTYSSDINWNLRPALVQNYKIH